MAKSYSIVEAKNHFTELVRVLETEAAIQVTRRGKPAAFLLSPREYQRLQQRQLGFWRAYSAFHQQLNLEGIDLNPEEIFVGVREPSAGREVAW